MMAELAKLTNEELDLVYQIAQRAEKWALANDVEPPFRASLTMDLVQANAATPIDFAMLLVVTDVHFVHDVWGIVNHLDRATGSLGTFSPRTARRPTLTNECGRRVAPVEPELHPASHRDCPKWVG